MDYSRILDFDVLGDNPKNYFRNEKILIEDQTCPWVIPDASPFYETDLELYDESGALIHPRSYSFEGMFMPFVELTGKPIWSFIRLDDDIRQNNAFITINYRSIGAYFVPRSEIQKWMHDINIGNIPIGWEKVFGLPVSYNPSWHLHDSITEIGDWFEFVLFFKMWTGIRQTRDVTFNDQINQVSADTYAKMAQYRDQQLADLKAHDSDYTAPHKPGLSDLGLGNRPNMATGSAAEELAGTSDSVLSTPRGARNAIKKIIPDTEGIMQNGIMPLSLLGGGDFIPPTIDGSFEGLGSDNESTGFCLENNGRLMLLTRHFDGRNAALYFSYVDNFRANRNGNNIVFTGFKYTNQFITADGAEPNNIIAGSNHKVLMVGVQNTANWYLALTNGTFDPKSHAFVKVDMTPIRQKANNAVTPNYGNGQTGTVHRLGDWIYFIESTGLNGNGANGSQYFFRVRVSDILAGNNVVWEHVPLTYTDYYGATFSRRDYYKMFDAVLNANNKVTRAGYYFSTPMDGYSGFYRKFVVLSGEIDGLKTRTSISMIAHTYLTVQVNGASYSVGPDIDISYEFNPDTGVMLLQDKSPEGTWDYLQRFTGANNSGIIDPAPYSNDSTFPAGFGASVVLPTGEWLHSRGFDSAKNYPRNFRVSSNTNALNEFDYCRRSLYNRFYTGVKDVYYQQSVLASPLKSGVFPGCVSYCSDGELYTALNQNDNSQSLFLKVISGGFAVRDEVKLINYPNVQSRPLGNRVYKTNLHPAHTRINITGPAAQLSSAGRETGDTLFSVGKCINLDDFLTWDPQQGTREGIELTFPKTTRRTLNQDMTAVYDVTRYYGVTAATIAQLYAKYVPANASGAKSFTVAMFPDDGTPMSAGITIGIMAFMYYTGNSTVKLKKVSFRPVIEAAGGTHPNVDLITGFTELNVEEGVVTTNAADSQWGIGIISGSLGPNIQMYRSGNTAKVCFYTGFSYTNIGNTSIATSRFDVDLTSGIMTNVTTFQGNWLLDGTSDQAIPNVGLCPNIFSGEGASPSAQVCRAADGTTFVSASVYPSPLWSIFFKEGTRALLNGTKYMLPIGIQDLRDIDPDPRNKTFYVYVGVDEKGAKYLIVKDRLRHNNFLVPVATIVCGEKQVLTITTRQPFLIGDRILSARRDPGTIPASLGMPMDEGSFRYIYQSDLT